MQGTLSHSTTFYGAGRDGLSRRQKAAMVVQLLLAGGLKLPLMGLQDEQQVALTRELAALRGVDRQTLDAVVAEFSNELEQLALSGPGGIEAALSALSGALSPGATARLQAEVARARGLDPWSQVIALPVPELVAIMQAESTEVAAVLLSKLPVGKAAELLGKLPGDKARRITFSVSLTSDVTPAAVARIGQSLALDHCDRPLPAFLDPAVQRVGAILNSTLTSTRDNLLTGLSDTDPEFADKVRQAMFTFVDLPKRVQPLDVPKAIRGIDQVVLVTALVHAKATGGDIAVASDFILSNMSQRMADQLRESMAERGRVRLPEGEVAMTQVVSFIRERADAGELVLKITAEEDEEDAAT